MASRAFYPVAATCPSPDGRARSSGVRPGSPRAWAVARSPMGAPRLALSAASRATSEHERARAFWSSESEVDSWRRVLTDGPSALGLVGRAARCAQRSTDLVMTLPREPARMANACNRARGQRAHHQPSRRQRALFGANMRPLPRSDPRRSAYCFTLADQVDGRTQGVRPGQLPFRCSPRRKGFGPSPGPGCQGALAPGEHALEPAVEVVPGATVTLRSPRQPARRRDHHAGDASRRGRSAVAPGRSERRKPLLPTSSSADAQT